MLAGAARKAGQAILAAGAVLAVCLASVLALIVTLIGAPPVKRLADSLSRPVDDQAP